MFFIELLVWTSIDHRDVFVLMISWVMILQHRVIVNTSCSNLLRDLVFIEEIIKTDEIGKLDVTLIIEIHVSLL